MNTATSKGVNISVEKLFRPDQSDIVQKVFLFNYKITIENRNKFPIKLYTRHWRIFDSLDKVRFVDGAGVIGEQPIIEPGEVFVYSSACDLISEIGFMEGHYNFALMDLNHVIQDRFKVDVPRFYLECPFKLN